ncbi:FmdB family zinc ribbon protein [Aestuariimicrobium ganziense]|uniref:FmdB family zinc ribbon protein n=1 Tax=Aestuariimicrobium ganziense TaxID=2773677 RepID=UPI0019407E24|nr:FmdB family zinc ribbon protein [Aestuariimicrobium ganziense]
MPTYQYRCADCGSQLEVVQKFTDHALTECPSCQGRLRKVYNAVGVHFKGSGFYATDSRNARSASSTSGSSTSSSSNGNSSSSTSSESSTSSSSSGSSDSSSSSGTTSTSD